eukprot:CAMPEP_0205913744 /NCGR_PEP_ID=MMETSP1325-20131115/6749_1 /ASSEMBLY_ACC=CAM_ASM_000708 /TAXON_ID=236786 /ORGANISM="Florenciella sp., Strain RCC1007" /LENGTH=66 /DNA_ID=CAMNT_0053280669 /DNA_START=150 /DNA_END=351 /DNA_ORIENTATION=-
MPLGGRGPRFGKDAGVMVTGDPSWNTDQGVKHWGECLGAKPAREMKVNAGESFGASPTDPDVLGWI